KDKRQNRCIHVHSHKPAQRVRHFCACAAKTCSHFLARTATKRADGSLCHRLCTAAPGMKLATLTALFVLCFLSRLPLPVSLYSPAHLERSL
ncbi:hypothetical protein INR49_006886, partial [Caranx melampygus]